MANLGHRIVGEGYIHFRFSDFVKMDIIHHTDSEISPEQLTQIALTNTACITDTAQRDIRADLPVNVFFNLSQVIMICNNRLPADGIYHI